ncbi:MAG: PrsW family intramembrane metalloprotease [Bacillota bacterium]|nr:PrsW family intramembrane metalloprotease [Bacillota bacterium]
MDLIFVAMALLPAALLMYYIYKKDGVEKEPGGLLFRLFLFGCIAAVLAGTLESLGTDVLSLFLEPGTPAFTMAFAFLVVAVIEEGLKFFFLKRRTWNHPAFSHRFDGVVYAVFVSLGFAALENLGYVAMYGLSAAISRAFLAVPAHMGFAVFMGSCYGDAKACELRGRRRARSLYLWAGYLLAVFLHGFYDTCAMLQSTAATTTFFAFVILMYILVIRHIRKEAREDAAFSGAGGEHGSPWQSRKDPWD